MDENPYEPPQTESTRGTSRRGWAIVFLVIMTIIGTIVGSPADPISMVIVAPIVGGGLLGAYLLGVWSERGR
jgi:hypothetical protein